MPELPEVEIIKRIIEPQIAGKTIRSVKVYHPQVIAHPDENDFTECLTGQTIAGMSRRGKFLIFHFVSEDRLVLHLRMTGQLLVTPGDYPMEKHTHFVADLSDGKQIRYIDVRRFGRFWYLKSDEEDVYTGQDKLGLEPFDERLTASCLMEKLGRKKKTVKEMLHDQSVVAGIGNIYSDEILYAAGIYPGEKCIDLSEKDWGCLADKIKEIIRWGIDTNEMTAEEYLDGKGKEYRNIPNLMVYGRSGQPCHKCSETIEKIVIGGRSSSYCPCCQKKK